eukprot:TRINITY_DN43725_c0_g1_i1.p1 TRINITY_DN43725_c0_g1~~TRINITY_DN43725_c0_g1_i1.p1  ORF type:complete len:189 (+),score=3.64 TRINITY_DN43725_c0_g1_i1:54-569(+)
MLSMMNMMPWDWLDLILEHKILAFFVMVLVVERVMTRSGVLVDAEEAPISAEVSGDTAECVGLEPPNPVKYCVSAEREVADDRMLDAIEVGRHRCTNDCWIILHGKVYDVTTWIPLHPGGGPILLSHAGQDATTHFDSYHSHYSMDQTAEILTKTYVGDIDTPWVKTTPKW